MIECYGHGERQPFPEEEFRHDPDGKIHRPYIHKVPKPHYAGDGTPVYKPVPIIATLTERFRSSRKMIEGKSKK